jgi:hypothetical protein
MKFYFFNHQNKGLALVRALESKGWIWTALSGNAHLIFSDSDVPSRSKSLTGFRQRGKKIFLYPHAARPNLFNDFPGFPPFSHVAAHLVCTPGHIEILKRFGHPHHFEAIGWYLCPIKPFQPREHSRKVLFAPIHPNSNGSLSKIDQKINAETYRRLLALVESGEIDLTVRFLRGLEKNGLWLVEGVTYIEGQPDQSYEQIDSADLVVSHQTFAHIAVARGVPTIMMSESTPPRLGSEAMHDFKYVQHWDQYKDLMMYPLDILAEDDTAALFARAVQSDCEIADWRQRLIGEPFDPAKFIGTVERYL